MICLVDSFKSNVASEKVHQKFIQWHTNVTLDEVSINAKRCVLFFWIKLKEIFTRAYHLYYSNSFLVGSELTRDNIR